MLPTDLEEMNQEAEALHNQLIPLLDNHSCGAIMLALAHLFARWLTLYEYGDVTQRALLFNNTALEVYAAILREEEVLH